MAAEDVKEAQGGGTTEATGHVEQEGSTKILFLAPTFVNILTQTLHFSTFSVTSGKKNHPNSTSQMQWTNTPFSLTH